MIDDSIYKFFADYIFEKTGIMYKDTEYYRLESRLKELTEIFEVENVQDVYNLFKSNITPDMSTVLINISTNNETFFFRDQKVFDSLTKGVYEELDKLYPNGPIEVWSAASSTGQEPLSVVIQTDKFGGSDHFSRLRVTATDISETALDKAKAGIYSGLDVQRGLPITLLMGYFDQNEDETWSVNSKMINKISYDKFNLLDGMYPANRYHVILCRNVLIYQTKQNKEMILQKLYDSLKPGGVLFMGNGESLIGISSKFERVQIADKTAYKRVN